ncbi:hypothetical protein ASG88_06780 [Nocardioides sp. Soil777]|uniref:DUF3105 domain-containing protein n=1 Tax=Nocardioides sp. Soil777 TaxID=1736409 RepID=UPI0007033AF8|nr:DUF3105 domain-containing protein [Nocardioides sp. Soil777]KRF03044.1 hypothetical protein ASG88_06780 [Nocardioides sp. Soil777]
MSKKDRTDRQAVIDSIRKKQAGTEKRRGFALVGASILVALVIIGAAAYQPIKNWWDLRSFDSQAIEAIGAPASDCGEITTKKATGGQDHVEPGTPLQFEDSPPAFGQHYNVWDGIERKLYNESDRPDVGELVHNLEHGYTILWYDETVAGSDAMMDDLRGIASKKSSTTNLRDKFKAVPWTSEDGDPFPSGQHVAMTHWSVGGEAAGEGGEQVGVFQYCSAPSGEALDAFMEQYPYMDSPEPTVL